MRTILLLLALSVSVPAPALAQVDRGGEGRAPVGEADDNNVDFGWIGLLGLAGLLGLKRREHAYDDDRVAAARPR